MASTAEFDDERFSRLLEAAAKSFGERIDKLFDARMQALEETTSALAKAKKNLATLEAGRSTRVAALEPTIAALERSRPQVEKSVGAFTTSIESIRSEVATLNIIRHHEATSARVAAADCASAAFDDNHPSTHFDSVPEAQIRLDSDPDAPIHLDEPVSVQNSQIGEDAERQAEVGVEMAAYMAAPTERTDYVKAAATTSAAALVPDLTEEHATRRIPTEGTAVDRSDPACNLNLDLNTGVTAAAARRCLSSSPGLRLAATSIRVSYNSMGWALVAQEPSAHMLFDRMLQLGVTKVFVDNLTLLGCPPWLSRPGNYGSCIGNIQVSHASGKSQIWKPPWFSTWVLLCCRSSGARYSESEGSCGAPLSIPYNLDGVKHIFKQAAISDAIELSSPWLLHHNISEVELLLQLGVPKTLVHILSSLGWSTWLLRHSDYGSCEGNVHAINLHNGHLLDWSKKFTYRLALYCNIKFCRLMENDKTQHTVWHEEHCIGVQAYVAWNMFDLVISDVTTHAMDGFKLLELDGLPMDLPVIMLAVNGETKSVMQWIAHDEKVFDFWGYLCWKIPWPPPLIGAVQQWCGCWRKTEYDYGLDHNMVLFNEFEAITATQSFAYGPSVIVSSSGRVAVIRQKFAALYEYEHQWFKAAHVLSLNIGKERKELHSEGERVRDENDFQDENLVQRLGGKPHFKTRGMSGTLLVLRPNGLRASNPGPRPKLWSTRGQHGTDESTKKMIET